MLLPSFDNTNIGDIVTIRFRGGIGYGPSTGRGEVVRKLKTRLHVRLWSNGRTIPLNTNMECPSQENGRRAYHASRVMHLGDEGP
jgi:hypothetical protein